MLVCMDPSSPPVKRTLHLLKTPDILLANDTGLCGNYKVNNIKFIINFRVISQSAVTRPRSRYMAGNSGVAGKTES